MGELRAYLVSHDVPVPVGSDIDIVTCDDDTFIGLAEQHGEVHTLSNFVDAFNAGEICIEVDQLRILEVESDLNKICINNVELAAELAEERTLITFALEKPLFVEENDGTLIYTTEFQTEFDKWYDYYLNKIEKTKNG